MGCASSNKQYSNSESDIKKQSIFTLDQNAINTGATRHVQSIITQRGFIEDEEMETARGIDVDAIPITDNDFRTNKEQNLSTKLNQMDIIQNVNNDIVEAKDEEKSIEWE